MHNVQVVLPPTLNTNYKFVSTQTILVFRNNYFEIDVFKIVFSDVIDA